MKQKVFVAMSGGVDSSVAAVLLRDQGYDVEGVFMKNWSGEDYGVEGDCPWEIDQTDAENVCKKLKIPFRSINFEKEYRERVVNYFFDEVAKSRTPNPDVMCNREIKFGIFLEKALELGADLIATGHYARRGTRDGKFTLLKGKDSNKDQSYFLSRITQDQLAKALFPIGDYEKPQIRKIAKEQQLPTANKPDSQGICFIGKINVREFLATQIKKHTGKIVDVDNGQIVGEHIGVEFYTIGQREGLGIGGAALPYYVCAKSHADNIVYVCQGSENKALYKSDVRVTELSQINQIEFNTKISAAIRYRQTPASGIFTGESFKFDQPQRAVAEGQIMAFYNGEECLGSGIIQG